MIISKYNSPLFLEKLHKDYLYKHGELLSVEAGPYLPTQAELSWLKSFLTTDIATSLLSETTSQKLEVLLKDSPKLEWENYLTKKQVPHTSIPNVSYLYLIKQAIRENNGIHLTYETKSGKILSEEGCPIEFVYNIAKKRWYIKWCSFYFLG